MQTRTLGPFTVSAIGYGAMQLSSSRRPPPPRDEAIATIHAALDAGITLIDTADCYAPSWDTMGHNEELVGAALRAHGSGADGVVVATKGGITRHPPDGWGRGSSPEYLRGAVERSLTALGVDVIDLYQWHRPDGARDYGEVVETFAALRDEGKIRAIGISNANVAQIDVAVEVLGPGGLASVQNEFSPSFLSSRDELAHCGANGIAFLPWSPLGGSTGAAGIGERHEVFTRIGRDRGVSPQRVVLAWGLAQGDHVIPIPGARRAASIVDSAAAADLELTAAELEDIETALV